MEEPYSSILAWIFAIGFAVLVAWLLLRLSKVYVEMNDDYR